MVCFLARHRRQCQGPVHQHRGSDCQCDKSPHWTIITSATSWESMSHSWLIVVCESVSPVHRAKLPGLTCAPAWVTWSHLCTGLSYLVSPVHRPELPGLTCAPAWVTWSHLCTGLSYLVSPVHRPELPGHTCAPGWVTWSHLPHLHNFISRPGSLRWFLAWSVVLLA